MSSLIPLPMRLPVVTTICVVLSGVASASPASAEEAVHHVGVSAVAGLGTPLGVGGVEAQFDVAPWLVASAGAGMGLSAGAPQLAGMARLRWAFHRNAPQEAAVTAGYGLSTGMYDDPPFCVPYGDLGSCGPPRRVAMWWHNGELALEMRSGRSGSLLARAFGGVALAGNPGALKGGGVHALPFFGGAFGFLLR